MTESFDSSKRSTLHDVAVHEPVIKESRAKRLYLMLAIAVIVILIGYSVFALVTAGKESTDDAQVAADVVPVAARIGGQIAAVHVAENQVVHRGDLIAELDARDAEVRVTQAQSEVDT